jgi:hypothetical protein
MRPSEYLGLKWSDINFEKGTVSVSRTLNKDWRGWVFAEIKRDCSRRVIRLQSWVVKLLDQLRIERAQNPQHFAEWPEADDLIFVTTKGGPIAHVHAHYVEHRFARHAHPPGKLGISAAPTAPPAEKAQAEPPRFSCVQVFSAQSPVRAKAPLRYTTRTDRRVRVTTFI